MANRRSLSILALVNALPLLVGCAAQTTGYGPYFEPLDSRIIRLGILAPEITSFEVSSGGVPEYRVDWSRECNRALTEPLVRGLAPWGFTGIPLIETVNDSSMDNLKKVLRLHCDMISRYLYGQHAFLPQIEKFDYALDEIGPVCDRYGLDGVMFLYGFDENFSPGRRGMLRQAATMKTVQSACIGLVLLPLTGTLYYRQYRAPMERTLLCGIVASRDGSVVWFNRKMAADDADLNTSGSLAEYLKDFLSIRRKK